MNLIYNSILENPKRRNSQFLLIFICFLSALLLFSCEKNSDLEVPHYKAKLVLHSFISPSDSFVRVHVSTTKNIYGKIQDYPKSLPVTVKLIDGEKIITLGKMDSTGTCSVKYSVVAGKEYKLEAQCDGYPDVNAFCRIPEANELSISIDTMVQTTIYQTYIYDYGNIIDTIVNIRIFLKFNDIANQSNFYNIMAKITSYFNKDSMSYPLGLFGEEDSETSNLLSDRLTDGKTIVSSFVVSPYYQGDSSSTVFEAIVLETDADYYKYHMSLKSYSGADDPFTEFSPIYSNVNGGFGIFSSYVMHKVHFRLR